MAPSQGDRKSQGRGKPQYISKKRLSRFVILSEILRFAQDDNPNRMTIRTQILRFAQDDNSGRMTIRAEILRFAQDDNPEQDDNSEG